ncbi:hypothetical protein LTR49_023558 [Elasticomyces elasticus]|nr:hypothetical protein LTR49_023558 [Elasticomyces elasticus]
MPTTHRNAGEHPQHREYSGYNPMLDIRDCTLTCGQLPPELLIHVFSYLPTAPPSDIAACRLVNRAFKELSSPFLLPCVVFARRLEVITKLREVLQHPYFRRHVKELIYDGSSYAQATATDWDQYVEDCERAPRDMEDVAWKERQRHDDMAWNGLASFSTDKITTSDPSDTGIESREDGVPINGLYEAAAAVPDSNSALHHGCNQSFADYSQRYADQERLRSKRAARNILAAAFTGFPNLNRLTYTDYRGLAYDGEDYDACCRRQFGSTLEPQHAGIAGPTTTAGDCLLSLLNDLAETSKVRLRCLAIGPHAFEYTRGDTVELADPCHPQNPQYLDISGLELISLGPETRLFHMLNQLETLRLALCYSGYCSDEVGIRSQARRLLEASAPRLQSLTLHMIYLFWGGVREIPRVDNVKRFEVFKSIITPLHMPYLRSLSLRRWIFTAEQLKAFLLTHKATLRDLHLLGCLCGDDETSLAQWAGQSLTLMGVELSGFLSSLDHSSANPYSWKCVDLEQWEQMRPTVTEVEARRLEGIWLAGRQNCVKRQQRCEIPPGAEWWKQPAYW